MRKLVAIVAATSAVGLGACEPFSKEPGGTPHVISAFATIAGTPVDGTAPTAAGAVTINAIPSFCAAGVPSTDVALFWVKFNKLLDGASIQAAPDSCAPAASWLTASNTPAGGSWYSCYNPSSPTPSEGASVVIFWSSAAPPVSGWDFAEALPASNSVVTTYNFTGSVKDKGGAAAAINITGNVDANTDPGVPGTPSFTGVTATSVVVSWAVETCVPVTSYDLQRAPDVAGAPGTFATITNTAATTFTDTGLTTATKYWYRVIANTAGGAVTSAAASVTTL